jgi:hypothetical protein
MRLIDILSFSLSVFGLYGLVFYLRFLLPRNIIPHVWTAQDEVEALFVRAEAFNAIPNTREHYRTTLAILGNQLLRARTESHRSPQFFQQFRLAFWSGLTCKLYVLRSQIEDTRRKLELALDERQLTSLTTVQSATSTALPVPAAVTAVPTVNAAEPAPPPPVLCPEGLRSEGCFSISVSVGVIIQSYSA